MPYLSGEASVCKVRKVLTQQVGHHEARQAGGQGPTLHVHVRPRPKGPDDAGVGGGPAHPLRLELLDKAGLRVSVLLIFVFVHYSFASLFVVVVVFGGDFTIFVYCERVKKSQMLDDTIPCMVALNRMPLLHTR